MVLEEISTRNLEGKVVPVFSQVSRHGHVWSRGGIDPHYSYPRH